MDLKIFPVSHLIDEQKYPLSIKEEKIAKEDQYFNNSLYALSTAKREKRLQQNEDLLVNYWLSNSDPFDNITFDRNSIENMELDNSSLEELKAKFNNDKISNSFKNLTYPITSFSPLAIRKKYQEKKAIYRLIPSSDRKIKHLVFYFPLRLFPDNKEELNLHRSIVDLANAIQVPVIIFSDIDASDINHPKAFFVEFITSNIKQEVCWKYVKSEDTLLFSMWAKDAFLPALDKKDDIILLCPQRVIYRGSSSDPILPQLLATRDTARHEPRCPLFKTFDFESKNIQYDGGNILTGDNFILVGKDTFLHNSTSSNNLISNHIDSTRKVIHIGGKLNNSNLGITLNGGRQSIFHIDLLISLAGRNSKTGKYRLVIGCPHLALTPKEFSELPMDQQSAVYEELQRMTDGINSTIIELEQATCKNELPFEIYRIPFALSYIDKIKEVKRSNDNIYIQKEKKYKAVRNWFWSSYNGIVEIDEDQKKVWLPSYAKDFNEKDSVSGKYKYPWDEGQKKAVEKYFASIKLSTTPIYGNWEPSFAPLEEETKRVWKELGFEVLPIGETGFHIYSLLNAGIPCIVNCI